MTASLVVLASGNGSNLQAILDACADGRIDAAVAAVASDHPDAQALIRAQKAGVAALPIPKHKEESRADYDARLAAAVAAHQPDWVVLAGWMRVLSMAFLGRFPGKVVNLHPALPGEFPGLHAIERAHASGRSNTGVMVHLVPDEGVDDGPVLATAVVPIHPAETLDALESRIHSAEHRLLVSTLAELCAAPPLHSPHHETPDKERTHA